MNPKIMELVIREADEIYGGMYGFVLTSIHNVLAPNAGIDKSNIPKGNVVLYPKRPLESIESLRNKFLINSRKKIGIVLSDSRILPMRKGTVGIALAICGFEPVIDLKGLKDSLWKYLKVHFTKYSRLSGLHWNHDNGGIGCINSCCYFKRS